MRQPIVVVMGHVDHGKTTLLDKIRGSAVAAGEAGFITQHIGASEIPLSAIKGICTHLTEKMGIPIDVPGLLFVDTPGHEAFTTLRKRGGSIADMAVLVVDLHEGFKQQTHESVEILKLYKTPFVVAATKMDKITSWSPKNGACFSDTVESQIERCRAELEEKVYRIVGNLAEHGFNSDRFDRVSDFRNQVAIVPMSSVTGEGLADLLVIIAGLSQQFMKSQLETSGENGEGTILEVKDVRGLGTTIDVILYNGKMRQNDWLIVGGKDIVVTKIRALLKPPAMSELRVEKKFDQVTEAVAADGIKVSAPGLENAIAGNPVRTTPNENEIEALKDEIRKEISNVEFSTDKEGIMIKADTLGSLEALMNLAKNAGIQVRKAEVGSVSRNDVAEAQNYDTMNRVIFAFNAPLLEEAESLAKDLNVTIFQNDVVYRLLEKFQEWKAAEEKRIIEKRLSEITRPCKIKMLRGYVFRDSNPAIFGAEILGGTLRPGCLMKRADGKIVGKVKELQENSQNVNKAVKDARVAVSMDEPTIGRQINEDDVLSAALGDNDLQVLRELRASLTEDERKLLDEYQ